MKEIVGRQPGPEPRKVPIRMTSTEQPPAAQVPLVDYLVLGDEPHLMAYECTSCQARFFDRRNACAACGGTSFERVPIATEGTLRAFTIVSMAAPA